MLEKPTAFHVARRTRKARGHEYAKNVLQTTLSRSIGETNYWTQNEFVLQIVESSENKQNKDLETNSFFVSWFRQTADQVSTKYPS